jgi:hypothetical protein
MAPRVFQWWAFCEASTPFKRLAIAAKRAQTHPRRTEPNRKTDPGIISYVSFWGAVLRKVRGLAHQEMTRNGGRIFLEMCTEIVWGAMLVSLEFSTSGNGQK